MAAFRVYSPMFNLRNHVQARLPAGHPPVLTVIIDTEEEFDWGLPFSRANIQTESIAAQPLAHEAVFDALGVVPTYVLDWPVCNNPAAVSVLRGLMEQGRCDIGTHLHPWVSPPYSEEVNRFNSYAGNLPRELEFEKIRLLTDAISQNFGRQPTVFKAGRYGVGPNTSETLAKLGYLVDVSVVPFTECRHDGGPDFSGHDAHPFWFGDSAHRMLEIPATTGYSGHLHRMGRSLFPKIRTPAFQSIRLAGIASRLGLLERIQLTPEEYTADELIGLTDCMLKQGVQVFGLTYHSPSLVPGNTPFVKSEAQLKEFLNTLKVYLSHFSRQFGGVFLSPPKLYETLK